MTNWFTLNGYSGILLPGAVPISLADFAPLVGAAPVAHMDRAVWLTSQVEAPKWGTVQGYDGAAMSGGLLHNVSVLPKTVAQGDLFGLLAKIFEYVDAKGAANVPVTNMRQALQAKGWTVARDGVLRNASGLKVSGQDIRNEFTPPDGKVPRQGPQFDQAMRWAMLFHNLFSDPGTRRAQIDYAALWLARGKSDLEMSVYRKFAVGLDTPVHLPSTMLPVPVDLAMCVYHSFSVNAPATAAECLEQAMALVDPSATAEKFATALLRRLGKREFGKWTDKPGDGDDRYDRTRKAVWASGIWDTTLTHQLMPTDL